MFGTNPHKKVIYYIMINDVSIFWGGWYYRYRCTLSFCGVSIDIHRVFLRCMLGGCTCFRCGRAPASDERVLAVGQTFGGFQWFSMDTPASTDAINHPDHPI